MSKNFYKYTVAARGKRPTIIRYFPTLEDCLAYAPTVDGARIIHRTHVDNGHESLSALLQGIDAATLQCFQSRIVAGKKRFERTIDVYTDAYAFGSQDNGKLTGIITCFAFSDVNQLIAIEELPDVIPNS